MKLTVFFLLCLVMGTLAISKRSDEVKVHQHVKVEGSLGNSSESGSVTQVSKACAASSSNVLIQLAETLGTVISLLLKPVLQLLGFKNVRELLVFLVNVVKELLDAVLNPLSIQNLQTESPEQALQGYPTLLSLVQLLVNILKVPLSLVGSLLAAVLALLSALL